MQEAKAKKGYRKFFRTPDTRNNFSEEDTTNWRFERYENEKSRNDTLLSYKSIDCLVKTTLLLQQSRSAMQKSAFL